MRTSCLSSELWLLCVTYAMVTIMNKKLLFMDMLVESFENDEILHV